MSEVVIVRRKSTPEVSFTGPEKEVLWSGLLQTAFSQPRKMIRSNLGKNATFAPVLERSGVEGTLRAAQLDWEHWRALAGAL
jgi:16S rRNA A1518/A1519 N6-dimethyltransferase RsmA/KsgA/DIM1 with predicted DNA glycosylase/AP lyase activity